MPLMSEHKSGNGAPSSDTTSPLFVSARKKQLEQQETERRKKEKEAERMKAEEEVHRLEAEVAERKRKAEAEAQRVAREEEQRQAEAEERRQKDIAEAAEMRRGQQNGAMAPESTLQNGQSAGLNILAKRKKRRLPLIVGGIAALLCIFVFIVIFTPDESDYKPTGGSQTDKTDYADLLLKTEGSWYLDGNMDSDRLDTDGLDHWDLYDSDGYLVRFGYFTVKDDGTILAKMADDDSETYSDAIDFIDSNCFYMQDEIYYSSEFSTKEGGINSESNKQLLDINAELNDYAIIDSIGMMIRFPNTIFQVDTLTESRLIIVSLDGAVSIEVSKGNSYDNVPTDKEMNSYRDKKLNSLINSLSDEAIVLGKDLSWNENNFPFVYFSLSYEGKNETRYVYFLSNLWGNERTGKGSYCNYKLECPEELADDYIALFNRIISSRDDA